MPRFIDVFLEAYVERLEEALVVIYDYAAQLRREGRADIAVTLQAIVEEALKETHHA